QDSRLLVAAEITEIGKGVGDAQVTLSLATEIEEDWLREMFPADFVDGNEIIFDPSQNRVVQRRERRFRGLVLESSDRDVSPDDEVALRLAEGIEKHELPLPGWDDAATQWIIRLNSLAKWMPELGLPAFGDEPRRDILLNLCEDAVSYRDVKDRSARPFLSAWLRPGRQALLDRHAPERVELPNGRKAKLVYREGAGPTLSAKIQELYGMKDTPKVAGGRIPVTLEILAPSHRPVQTTQDLASFWSNAYPKLKAELQRRYPKHEWR
ncbi:MAG TPA: ATP-dependent helicase C-terminal domain-containing protein, partial [Chthoniobacterales bacterium]